MRKKYRVYEYWKTGVNGKVENKSMNEPKFNKNIYRKDPFSPPISEQAGEKVSIRDAIIGIYIMSCVGYCSFAIIKFVFLKLIS